MCGHSFLIFTTQTYLLPQMRWQRQTGSYIYGSTVCVCVCTCAMHHLFCSHLNRYIKEHSSMCQGKPLFSKNMFFCHLFNSSDGDPLHNPLDLFTHGFCPVWDVPCCSFLYFEVWSFNWCLWNFKNSPCSSIYFPEEGKFLNYDGIMFRSEIWMTFYWL